MRIVKSGPVQWGGTTERISHSSSASERTESPPPPDLPSTPPPPPELASPHDSTFTAEPGELEAYCTEFGKINDNQ